MGKDIEEIAQGLDDMFGLGADNIEEPTNKSESETESKEVVPDNEEAPKSQNIILTPEQVSIASEMTKLDIKIEELKSHKIDENSFYENLEDMFSEEEAQLEFDDKPAYHKLVASKRDEFLNNNSKEAEIQELELKKEELASINERQSAITEISAKYPQYDHEKMMDFFQNELTKTQQNKIFENSNSYTQVYEGTHKKYIELNPTLMKQTATPDIPNLNNTRHESVKTSQVERMFKSDDEELLEALGL